MNPTTPSGTRTREISMPFGRRHTSTTVPTGSGSAAISRSPCAISSRRLSVSVRRSRNARVAPRPCARSTSARFASRSDPAFSTSPWAICTSASFLIFVGQSASARGVAGGAGLGLHEVADVHGSLLEEHEVVAVDHFVEAPVPQPPLDLRRLRPPDLPHFVGVEVHHAPRELPAGRAREQRHHVAGGKLPLDLEDARRQEARATLS